MPADISPTPARTAVVWAPHRRFLPIFQRESTERGLLYRGEPPCCRREWGRFLPVLAHLALLTAVARVYRVEGRGLHLVMALTLGVLPLHYVAHHRWKKLIAVAASLAGLVWVIGPDFALYIVPIGLALIAAGYLPVAWALRAAAVAAAAVGLGLARAGTLTTGVPDGVWPVLGSFFMFRMIIFFYELKHAETPPRPLDALCYFFLLPNVCFLHFPVVDLRTFLRGYLAEDVHDIQRAGLAMMTRGMAHLLAYRLVDHELLVPAEEVRGPAALALYLAANYLQYLLVSGQFHMACGLLHLFGFKLPETHHHYLLATGFTDYWRRINIYWKDFMVRLVFHPVAFRLKRRPQPLALAAATVAVFVATWALHAYQSFWLRGYWAFTSTDTLFWGVLGVLVLVNVQRDARNPARHRQAGRSARDLAIRAAKVGGTLVTLSLLWSLWNSTSVSAWLDLLRRGVFG